MVRTSPTKGSVKTMARTISVLVLALACLSADAATIADADALFKEKRWRKAAEACEAVRLFGVGKADRPFFLEMVSGELLFAEEDYKAAAATFRNGISQRGCPPSLRAYMTMRLARCLVKLREYKSALDAYTTIKTSYRNAPCAPDAMLMAGVLCVGHLDNVQAGEGFFKFIEDEYPKSPEAERALFYRTTLAIWTKRWDEAKALRQLFVGRYPNSRQIGIMKGEYSELIARRITSLDDNETGNLR